MCAANQIKLNSWMNQSPIVARTHPKEIADTLSKRLPSPKAGYIRDRAAEQRSLADQSQYRLLRAQCDLEIQERTYKAQQQVAALNEQLRFVKERLQAAEEKAQQYKGNAKRMQGDLERVLEVNESLEERLAYTHERLVKIIAKFRKEYLPSTVDSDPLTSIDRYTHYLQSLLQDQARKTQFESTKAARIAKQIDSVAGKCRALEAHNNELARHIDLQAKQRKEEQEEMEKVKQHSKEALMAEGKAKKALEAEMAKLKEKAERRKEKNRRVREEMEEQIKRKEERETELEEQLLAAKNQTDLMNGQVEELKGMLDQASGDMGTLEEQYSQLKIHLLNVEKDLLRSSTEAENISDMLKKTTIELQSQTRQNKLKQDRISELERKNIIHLQDLSRAHKELANLSDENSQLKKQIKILKNSIEQLKKIPNKQEQLINQLQEKQNLTSNFEYGLAKLKHKLQSERTDEYSGLPSKGSTECKPKIRCELQPIVNIDRQANQSD